MSYCTITDIRALNPQRTYSAVTTPTATQVEAYITQIAGELDATLLGRGLSVPVSTPAEFVAFLLQLNAVGAAARAEQAMFPEAKGLGTTPAAQVLWKQYQDGLKWLREGKLPTGTTAEALPFSFRDKHVGTEDEPSEDYDWQKPKFGMSREF